MTDLYSFSDTYKECLQEEKRKSYFLQEMSKRSLGGYIGTKLLLSNNGILETIDFVLNITQKNYEKPQLTAMIQFLAYAILENWISSFTETLALKSQHLHHVIFSYYMKNYN